MVSKKTLRNKLIIIACLVFTIVFIQLMITPTISRLRNVHNDEVRGYYTALHLSHDAEGKVVAVEEVNKDDVFDGYVGSFSFTINNFDNSGITQRDISYKIYTKEILQEDGEYYVTGVWGRKIPIKPDTVKYTINIVGEGSTSATATEKELISYATTDPNATPVGASNTHMIQIKRNASAGEWVDDDENEEITIVIELNEPYHEIIVANISVSPRLIVYSLGKVEKLHTEAYRLHIQTASSFKQISNNDNSYLTDAFRVVLKWNDLLFDNTFNEILKHISSASNPDSMRIDRPYLIVPNIITTQKTLQMYIPAGSDFYIDFYLDPSIGSPNPQIYAYAELKYAKTGKYGEYTKYSHTTSITTDVSVTIGDETKVSFNAYKIPQ